MTASRTINILAAALGGEGGGVFSSWMIDVAEIEGWLCQTTSLAGVAQRTGATIYYLELFPRGDPLEPKPVMSLFPAQGDIDIAIASEIAEAGRMVQRGFVSRDRTTLIASDHRVYGISEKIDLGDGTIDADVLRGIAGAYSARYIHYDMLAIAEAHNSVISAVMLGALAGAGVLPFEKTSFEAAIRRTEKAVETNLAAFEASYQRALQPALNTWEPDSTITTPEVFTLPTGRTAGGSELLARLSQQFPAAVHELLYRGLDRLVDYQDHAYAGQYLDEMALILDLDDGSAQYQLTSEVGRWLALWMSYEDVPRVAQIKTRELRMEKIRSEVKAESDQLLHVTEFFRPRVEEMCALLPVGLGSWAISSHSCRRILGLFTSGKRLRTTSIWIFITLRCLAGLRRYRRGTLGYSLEYKQIHRWLAAVHSAAGVSVALASELAECGRLVKGYGETRQRTSAQMSSILRGFEQFTEVTPETVASWREAAMADDSGAAFESAMS